MNRTKSKFKVGDKVKRIRSNSECAAYKRVAYGKIYTVRKIDIYENISEDNDIIYLAGFPNEIAMWASRFVKARK